MLNEKGRTIVHVKWPTSERKEDRDDASDKYEEQNYSCRGYYGDDGKQKSKTDGGKGTSVSTRGSTKVSIQASRRGMQWATAPKPGKTRSNRTRSVRVPAAAVGTRWHRPWRTSTRGLVLVE